MMNNLIIEDKSFYTSFDGRVTREQYLINWFIPLFVAWIVVGMLSAVIHILVPLFSLATIWPSLAINTKRLHDRGKSGFWQLLLLIPLVGFLWWIYEAMICTSAPGANKYGPEPVKTIAP